jgi:hypothetical protein
MWMQSFNYDYCVFFSYLLEVVVFLALAAEFRVIPLLVQPHQCRQAEVCDLHFAVVNWSL